MRRLLVLLLLFAGFAASAQKALTYPRLVIFGDNYSDALNTYNATRTTVSGYDPYGNPTTYTDAFPSGSYGYQDGIFTNGYGNSTTAFMGVWHQQLHALLPGIPLTASVNLSTPATQTDYAWGSAGTGSGTTTVTFAGHFTVAVHNMNRQIDDYLNAGNTPDGQTLYVLFGGLNDLLADSSTASATTAAANVAAEAKRLVDGGALNVLIANVPGISANASSPIDVAAGAFRTQLAMDLTALQTSYALKGINPKLTTLDLYQLYANIFAAPAGFGFTDVVDKANTSGSGGNPVSNVDQYLNWDGVNPTTAGHRQIALAACTALTGTVTKLTIDKVTATLAAPSTLTATVSTAGTYGPQSSATPGGTATFYYPQTVLATTTQVSLGTVAVGANGQASLTTVALPPGNYTVYAVYSGDANFPAGCASAKLSLTVAVAASSFDFNFAPPAAYLGMEEGQGVTLEPVSIGGFTGPVTFSCSNLAQFFACNFLTSPTVQVAANASYYSTVLISSGTPTPHAQLTPGPLTRRVAAVFACLLVCPMLLLGHKRVRQAGLLIVMLGLTLLTGCMGTTAPASTTPTNSDPGFGTTHGPGITYAAPGTYSVDITGTSGSLSVTHRYYIYIANTYDVGVTP